MSEFQVGNIGQNPCLCNLRSKNHNISVENVTSQNPPPQIENKDKKSEGNDEDSYSTLNGFVGSVKRIASGTVSGMQIVKGALVDDGDIAHKAVGIAFKQDGGAFSVSAFPDLIGRVACKVKKISDTVSSMFNIFTPFLDMVDSLTLSGDRSEPQENNKKTIKDLTNVFGSIEQEIEKNPDLKKGLSNESKAALDKFYNIVSKLSQREDLKDMDISRLIAVWRKDPNSAILLQMAQRIRRGECSPFGNARLRDAFVRSLESLGTALERLENRPQTPLTQQAIQDMHGICNPMVDSMEIHEQAGGDANYTQQDRIRIESNFRESHRRIQGLINNPGFSSCFSDVSRMLEEYSNFIFNFIHELFEERKEEERNDERTRYKKLCEERKNDKKLIRDYCKKYWIRKYLVNRLSRKLEEMRLNVSFHNMLVSRVSKRAGVNRTNIESDAAKAKLDYDSLEYKYKEEKQMEYYYKSMIIETVEDMPPSYVCSETMFNCGTNFNC